MTAPRRVAVLGSTGSIGRQTLDVLRTFADRFRVVALAAGRDTSLFRRQVAEFQPQLVHVRDHPGWSDGRARPVSLVEMVTAECVDLVVLATPGSAGIVPALATLEAGKPLALANKEALVAAGALATAAARRSGASILPIDSEHSAIWQCLQEQSACLPPCLHLPAVHRLILTASGGAFRDRPAEELARLSAAEALQHPVWAMGPKVTIDSASLLNKGFELIEAHWLFGIPLERVSVLIHRESIVHSLVEFVDGSVKAQLGVPDMRTPIQYALTFPERQPNRALPRLDLAAIGQLHFAAPEPGRFPLLDLALRAATAGGAYPAVLAGADEAAVALFLEDRIRFGDLASLVAAALDAFDPPRELTLEAVLDADRWARAYVTRRASVAV
ncbi:MAG: 1-deoxy-D-xylulose-5-phosphate reductoisomerase [Chloroflexi bacterium]|nr:1-deoxy-D-xylulose-5-phosphate reductoisomerase [Chloroflexota bacterium]